MTSLVAALTDLAGVGQEAIHAAFIVFLRVGAAMALLPAFGEQVVPLRVRLALGLAFTAIVAPAVAGGLPAADQALTSLFVTETAIGLMLGIALRLFVHALQIAGMMIAQSTSLAQIFAGAGAEPQPAIGHLLSMAGLALAVSAGLHVHVARYLILSYDLLPAGMFPDRTQVADWGAARTGQAFALAFSLAAPFVIAAFIYNVALGVINRAMPQLMVAFVGAPALTAGGLILLAVSAPLALGIWLAALGAFLETPFSVLR